MKKRFLATLLAVLTALTSTVITVNAVTDSDWEYEIADGKAKITKYTGSDADVTIPATFEGCMVSSIGYEAFAGCQLLETVNIPNSVTALENSTFLRCSSLKSIRISEQMIDIGFSSFDYCTSLNEIIVDEKNPSYKSVDGVLYNKDVTRLITVPGARTSVNIPNTVSEIEAAAFRGCASLSSINIPDSVKEIGAAAFTDCSALENIFLPHGITKLEMETFNGCSSLQSITIPSGVTKIGQSAFANCTSLEVITLPGSVTVIREWSFYNCPLLKKVRYCGSRERWENIWIDCNKSEAGLNAPVDFTNPDFIPGDTNGDGKLNARDITTIMRYLLDMSKPPKNFSVTAADFNGDNTINARDITAIMKKILVG